MLKLFRVLYHGDDTSEPLDYHLWSRNSAVGYRRVCRIVCTKTTLASFLLQHPVKEHFTVYLCFNLLNIKSNNNEVVYELYYRN